MVSNRTYIINCLPTLRVFENRVMRRVFGPKSDEVTGNGETYIMRSSVISTHHQIRIIRMIELRRMRWAGHVAHRGERRGLYRVLVGKPEGKRALG